MADQELLTPDQVKAQFRAQGLTVTQWAEERGYPRNAVYRVLNSFDKAIYGRAHEIAVALGIKADPNAGSQPAAA
ncbi:DNA-binding protein [Microbulbifer sp. ANSA003]|uniref:DNA-binding protein n=1 Tax=Microbulbifer okhotskensis TaxID=2926617 RepID=A0A9X2EN88_9GAMM|nr:DNA-binding protein [Microbulbifer okhotskensis]MCO1335344.1 DNA-binding protein [Microbulbifer okhotskensis]